MNPKSGDAKDYDSSPSPGTKQTTTKFVESSNTIANVLKGKAVKAHQKVVGTHLAANFINQLERDVGKDVVSRAGVMFQRKTIQRFGPNPKH